MTFLESLKYYVQKSTILLCYIGMALLIPMMLLTTGEVLGRAVWNKPIPGTLELSSYMLAVFILLGLAYTQQVKGHVRVEMLIKRLPERVGLVLNSITTLLSLFIIVILAWQGWLLGLEEKAVSDMLRIPQWPFKLLVFVAALSLTLELLIDLFETWGRLLRR